jgi:hypothetical protein
MLTDSVHHLAMPALLAFHVNGNDPMGRRHQQQRVKNQPQKHAKHDQNQIENRRKRLPVQQQADRRQHGCEDVDH